MGKCYNCGTDLEAPLYRNSECSKCGKDGKVCLNCTFYSKGSHWDCRETISEAVTDKEKSNFCDFFSLAENKKNSMEKKDDGVDAFNSLFGD